MTVIATGKIGKDYRVTLPTNVRDSLDLKEGDELIFYTVEDKKGRVCFRKGV